MLRYNVLYFLTQVKVVKNPSYGYQDLELATRGEKKIFVEKSSVLQLLCAGPL